MEFILVGGGAAVIHGAPVTTQGIDIVHNREAANVDRLPQVLAGLDARLVDPAGREFKPERVTLSGSGQSLIRTRLGRIDVLGALHDDRAKDRLVVPVLLALARQRAGEESN